MFVEPYPKSKALEFHEDSISLSKAENKLRFKPFFMVDKGYLGIKKLGIGCLMPSKEKKKKKLDSELKKYLKAVISKILQNMAEWCMLKWTLF